MTVNELNALDAHRKEREAKEKEMAAFAGYCAGVAFSNAWAGKLQSFDKFYVKSKSAAQAQSGQGEVDWEAAQRAKGFIPIEEAAAAQRAAA